MKIKERKGKEYKEKKISLPVSKIESNNSMSSLDKSPFIGSLTSGKDVTVPF